MKLIALALMVLFATALTATAAEPIVSPPMYGMGGVIKSGQAWPGSVLLEPLTGSTAPVVGVMPIDAVTLTNAARVE